MTAYTPIATSENLSSFVSLLQQQHESIMGMQRGGTEPTLKPLGCLWYDSTNEVLKQWNGTAWVILLSALKRHLATDGSVNMAGALNMANNQLIGLAAGTNSGHACRRDQIVLLDGTQPFQAAQSMGGNKLTNVGACTASGDAANKQYVDNAVSNVGRVARLTNPVIQKTDTVADNDLGFVPAHVIVKIYGDIVLGVPGFTMWDSQFQGTFRAEFWETESGKGFSPGDVWESDVQDTNPPFTIPWKLKLTRVDGSVKGLKIELIRDSNGARGTVDVYGASSGDGVLQVLAFG